MILKKDMLKGTAVALLVLVYMGAAAGCAYGGAHEGASSMIDMNNVKEINYRFIDASVPPQYHRSYTITVSDSNTRIAVDSYGDILAERDYPVSLSQFDALLNSFQTHKIRNCELDEGRGCTGGTSEKIILRNSRQEVFSGWVYHCGGEDYGNLCGDVSAFAGQMKKLVPDLDELTGV